MELRISKQGKYSHVRTGLRDSHSCMQSPPSNCWIVSLARDKWNLSIFLQNHPQVGNPFPSIERLFDMPLCIFTFKPKIRKERIKKKRSSLLIPSVLKNQTAWKNWNHLHMLRFSSTKTAYSQYHTNCAIQLPNHSNALEA